MINTLAFDFGQVIGFFDHGRTLSALVPFTDMSEQEMFDAIYNGEMEDALESGSVSERDFLAHFRDVCRLRCDDDYVAKAVADIFWPNEPLCALIPVLKKRYRLVLGSNTNIIHARHYVTQFADTLRHFDALVLSHEIGVRKPERGFFERVLRAADCRPQGCVFIDDMPVNIAGARACGLHGVVYQDVKRLQAEFAELGVIVADAPP